MGIFSFLFFFSFQNKKIKNKLNQLNRVVIMKYKYSTETQDLANKYIPLKVFCQWKW